MGARQSSFIPEQIKEDKIDHDEVKTGFSRFQYFHPRGVIIVKSSSGWVEKVVKM